MMRLWLAGLVFAWAGPWTCQKYTLPDGGSSSFNSNVPPPDGGGQSSQPYSQTASTQIDGGVSGQGLFIVVDADGGGVTLGPVANFTHNFAWIANNGVNWGYSRNGTVSLINTDSQQAIGNYPAAIPIDMAGQNFCKANPPTYGDNISSAMKCMLQNPGQESTSRTVVDLNGGVWAANRAWNTGCEVNGDQMDQPSVTHINNAIDHLADSNYPLASCGVRCPGRNGGQPVTSTLLNGNTIAPYSPFYTSATESNLWCPDPTGSMSALGSKPRISYNGQYYVDPTDYCNPVNYDDCVMYTIPIGASNGWNKYGVNTQGNYLARGTVIAPNCDPLTRECDIWVGLSWGGLAVRFSAKQPSGWTQPFVGVHQPTAAIPFATNGNGTQVVLGSPWSGATPYGAVMDCRGYLWGNNPGGGPQPSIAVNVAGAGPGGSSANGHMLYAIDTNAVGSNGQPTAPPVTQFSVGVNPGGGACVSQGATYVCNGLPTPWGNNGTQCGSYGVAVDVQGRIWVARYPYGGGACDFDPGKWLQVLGGVNQLGHLSYADYATALTDFDYPVSWNAYNMDAQRGGGCSSVGIVSDKNGNVYPTTFCTNSGAMGFVPDTGTLGANGVETGFQILFGANPTGPGSNTHGIDAAVDNSMPGGMALWGTDDSGDAVKIDPTTGNVLTDIPVHSQTGVGFYTYSDFTGYALRYITSPRGQYTQVFQGSGSAPEFDYWKSVSFSAYIPPQPQSPPVTGDDLILAVRVGDSIPQLAAATDTLVCDVGTNCPGVTCSGANCTGTLDISSLSLQGEYLAVDFLLETPGCQNNGLDPVLYTAGATSSGPGN